jgi:outer membrane protein assembly factor BamB
MKRYMILVLLPIALAGCDKLEQMGIAKSNKQVLLKGERETVLLTDETSAPVANDKAGAVVLPASFSVKDWPQAGYNSSHNLPHVESAIELKPAWETRLTSKATLQKRLLCEPIIADGLLFLYTPDSYLTAYDVEKGEFQWTIFIKPEKVQDAILGGGAAYSNGKLFISTPFAELFSVDAKTGTPDWSVKTNSPLRSAPTIADGRVYVVALNNELSVFDEATGKLLWTHKGVTESSGLLGGSTPSVHQSIVIAPYSSGEVHALQADNGYPLWSHSLASAHRTDSFAGMPHIRAKPVIQDGVTYVVSQAGRSAALDMRTGAVIWQHEFGGSQTPLIAGDSLFIMTSENQLMCLEKTKGLIRWTKPLPKWTDEAKNKGRIVWNGPILVGSKLFLTASYGSLIAIDATTGEKAYEYKVPGEVVIPPIAANGTVYVVTEKGSLIAFR